MSQSTAAIAHAAMPDFIPLALEEEDVAAYASMGAVLGCGTEACAEGFMLATPLARDLAVRLWRGAAHAARQEDQAQSSDPAQRAERQMRAAQALETMRALLGLDPQRMPHVALAAAGLRYSA